MRLCNFPPNQTRIEMSDMKYSRYLEEIKTNIKNWKDKKYLDETQKNKNK